MSSTASVVPNVSYHLPKPVTQNFQHFDCGSDGSVLGFNHQSSQNNDYGPTTNFMKSESSISASKLVSYNLDNALRLSLKSSTVPLNGHISNYTEKLSQRPLSFHESSAPPLDSIIKQKIQSLPRSLILEDSEECKSVKKSSPENKLLCSDDELDHLCQAGAHCIPKRALGFGNSGNTCYLNSVLQCILATGPLLAYINHKHSNPSSCIITNGRSSLPSLNKSRFCVLCGLSRLINEHHSQNGRTIPSYFVTNVRAICPSLRPYQQEDAHEFLLGLLSRMEDSSLASFGKVSRKISETNVIRRIFGGIIRSEVTCRSCLKVSARDEQCFNLSMDITCARSLQQCLCNYIRSEELSGQNAYKCENCHQLRPAMRKCTIYRAPPILIIQLNRFSRHQKLDIRVDFPSSFNLRPFMTQSKGLPILYKLYAIVNHEGYSCRSGHYVSFTLRHGQWLSLNDSFVSTTNPDHVLRQSPYLLFYEAVRNSTNGTVNRTVTSKESSLDANTPKLNNSQLPPVNDTVKQQQSITKPYLPSSSSSTQPNHHKTFNIIKQTNLLPVTTSSVISQSTSFTKTPTINSLCCSNPTTNTVSSVPKIVFNPKLSLNKINILPSPIVPSTSISNDPINSLSITSKSKNIQDIVECGKNHHSNIISTVPSASSSTSGTKTTISLSAATVQELLYGKETSSNLWTERPTPINDSVLSLSSTSSSSSTITTLSYCIKNPTSEQSSVTLCNNSDNLTTISTAKVQTTSSQLPSVNTAGLKDKQHELTNPLVDYSYEESDSDKNGSPPPRKRSRTTYSGSDSGIVWVPGNHNEKSKKHHTYKSSSDEHKRHKKKHKSRHSSKHSSSHHNSLNGSDDNHHHHNHRNRELDRSSSLPRPSSHHHNHDKHRRRHHHKKYRQESPDSKNHRFHSHHKHYKQSHSHENGYR
ncbi:unnamed protein product [Schistosoma margrebowiei]|uniref:Ubiquitin carboxyl-terminal hydrolase n=1 Tax=Schistosoma margrebowiei TaxID=48269 RepID=A0AA85AM47_9TREM|nr:unnamed protein product [Schistosoma margrebowiei]